MVEKSSPDISLSNGNSKATADGKNKALAKLPKLGAVNNAMGSDSGSESKDEVLITGKKYSAASSGEGSLK